MKKLITLVVAAIMAVACCFSLVACGDDVIAYEGIKKVEKASDIQIGFICLHDESSTYDKNFIDAIKKAAADKGIPADNVHFKTGVPESSECYDAAVELIETYNCNIIYADSFGHEAYMLQAAQKYPGVQFCHATGTKAHTEVRGNYHNAFASIYEGRYLVGAAAGWKLASDMQDKAVNNNFKVGYIGAYTYAEVVSGYTAWFLGVKMALNYYNELYSTSYTATMDVQFTGSWYDYTAEYNAATALINNGCVLISQHADSLGAPTACAEKNIPNVSYNVDTTTMSDDAKIASTYVASSRINWAPYFTYTFDCLLSGTEIALDWTGDLSTGSVEVVSIGAAATADTTILLEELAYALKAGYVRVFDINNFTVKGNKLTSYRADVDDMGDFVGETEVIYADTQAADAIVYFHESGKAMRSAPYFDLQIDGITLVNTVF